MGNKILGQCPSQTFISIRDNVLQDEIREAISVDKLRELSIVELKWFTNYVELLRYKAHQLEDTDRFIKNLHLFDIVTKDLGRLTKKSVSSEDYREFSLAMKRLTKLEAEIKLLDVVYGLKQCQLACRLLEEVSNLEEVRKRYQELSGEESSSATMQEEAIKVAKPSEGALQVWLNWSII